MSIFWKGAHVSFPYRRECCYRRVFLVIALAVVGGQLNANAQEVGQENQLPDFAAESSPVQLKLDEPLPEKIYYGNLIKDAKVDIKDVNRLATNWNSTQAVYRERNLLLLNQIATHYGEDIPAVLNNIGWENRALFTSLDGAAKRTATGKLVPLSKADEPLSIGRGFSNKDFVTRIVGLPIYPFTRDKLVKVSTGLGTNDPRYDFVDSNEFSSTYIDSFATASDVFGFDMNAEAKYVAFQGTFSASYDRAAYRSNKKHEFVVSQTIDFGWWELPRNQIQVAPAILAELKSPSGGYEKYGTHYVWAERRKASAYVKILIETSIAQDKVNFAAGLNTHFSGTGWSAALAASTSSLRAKFSQISNVTIEVKFTGGSMQDFSVDANDQTAVAMIPDKMNEWVATVSADTAAPTEWAVRPITDFVAQDTMGLIGRDVSMRRWFLKYSAVDTTLQELNAIIDTTFTDPSTNDVIPRFRPYYRYFEGGDRTPEDFYADYLWYIAKESELRAIGRNLYVDEEALFVSKEHPLRNIDKPVLFMTFANKPYEAAHAGQHSNPLWHQNIETKVYGGNWTESNGFQLFAPVLCGGPTETNGNESAGVRSSAFDASDNSTSCIIFAASGFGGNLECIQSMIGVTLEIRDLQDSNRLVYYQCATPNCSGVTKPQIPEPPFDTFKSKYELSAEQAFREQPRGDK